MSLARFAKKRDETEAAIIAALRQAGARVWLLDRPFDLLVLYGGRFVCLECKTGKRKLTLRQAEDIAECWRLSGPVYVVRTPGEALQAVGAIH